MPIDFYRSIGGRGGGRGRGLSVDSENVSRCRAAYYRNSPFSPVPVGQLRPCKTSDLSCVRWLVLMHHADGNAANIGGLKKGEGGGGKKKRKKGGIKGGAFTPIFKNDRSSPVFQNWNGTSVYRSRPFGYRILSLSLCLSLSLSLSLSLLAIPRRLCMLINPFGTASGVQRYRKKRRLAVRSRPLACARAVRFPNVS